VTQVADPFALAADAFTPREATLADEEFPTPGALAMALDPAENINPPHLQELDAALVKAASGEIPRLFVTMPPQEGKSTRAVRYYVLWLLKHNPDLRIAIVSFESDKAIRWGRFIRDDIETHDLGIRVREDVKAAGRWQIVGHRGSVYCTGWQGSLTSVPVDVLIIDDPVKGAKEVDSQDYRDDQWDWWISTARARLGPKSIVVLIQTRWHPDDLGGRMLENEGDVADGGKWTVLHVPAQAEEGDAIGRQPGEWLPSARGRTPEQWEDLKAHTPIRWWSAMYQGRPTPPEGAVWERPWIDDFRRRTGELPQLIRVNCMVDPSGSAGSEAAETGIVVLGLGLDGDLYVLDDRSLRASAAVRARRVCETAGDWNVDEIVIEEDFGGDNVEQLIRGAWKDYAHSDMRARRLTKVPTIRSIRASGKGSKRLRAEAAAGFYQQGRVHHVTDDTDRLAKLEQQQLEWTGDGDSPDRIDALAHGVRELLTTPMRASAPATDRWARARGAR
jgi:hypothetical protein